MRISIKPMSVNTAWQGKRFKTPAYRAFEYEIMLRLKKMVIPGGELAIRLDWGFSNYGASDWDNPIKPTVDCLQNYYQFNDNRIKQGIVTKHKVAKGDEFIEVEIVKYGN